MPLQRLLDAIRPIATRHPIARLQIDPVAKMLFAKVGFRRAGVTMSYETIRCDGQSCTIDIDRVGTGPEVLLLPALSSISTRRELSPLQATLAVSFSTILADWPGFGERDKPFVDWRPQIYEAYLSHLLTNVVPRPFAIVAAGHAAGYVIKHCAQHPDAAARLVLLSPTWRGPLPTMMSGDRPVFAKIARAFDPPLLGAMLYRLNVNRFVVGMMARGHVYGDPRWLDEKRMTEKLAVTRAPGARHGSARFVTGRLDPFRSRQEQIEAAERLTVPTLVMFAETAPRKSRLEMEALAALSNVKTERVARGKLSFYEEFPEETAAVVSAFLAAGA
jgi:pimeloyl-ACP methyl ester carboxylesterase